MAGKERPALGAAQRVSGAIRWLAVRRGAPPSRATNQTRRAARGRLIPYRDLRRLDDRIVALVLGVMGVLALSLALPGLLAAEGPAPLWQLLGWGAPVVVAALWMGAISILLRRRLGWQERWWAVVAGEALFLACLLMLGLLPADRRAAALAGQYGGLAGYALSRLLLDLGGLSLGAAWAVAAGLLVGSLAGLWFTVPPAWTAVALRWAALLGRAALSLLRNLGPASPTDYDGADADAAEDMARSGAVGAEAAPAGGVPPAAAAGAPTDVTASRRAAPSTDVTKRAPRVPKTPPVEPASPAALAPAAAERPARRKARPATLPPLDLLRPDDAHSSAADSRHRAQLLKQTLAEFGVPVEVVSIKEGPTVTQFGLEPGEIVRELSNGEILRRRVTVATIMRLSNDLALALAATSLRIEAPVPGRPYVGVEVPNVAKTMVSLRGILESKEFARVSAEAPLAVALGRDVSGDPVVVDLARMPHLLIAGATGSGKSVCINSIVSALLMNNSPATVRFLMVDPKMVELPGYNGIPHLLGPVITDPAQATAALTWLTLQMDERYRTFAAAGVRNIEHYNRSVSKRGRAASKDLMPYLVLVIDELADLMMTAAEDVERLICRLAQMARATGIHLVLATQRPSVDVITGLIKANFPARVAFAVTSQIDSRVILDSPGAEKLLGRGDMLFMAPDSPKLARIQGCFVSDQEIDQLTAFWRAGGPPEEHENAVPTVPPWTGILDRMEERDDLLEKALAFIQGKKTVSTSLLQRHLRLGYPRAARLMEQLEEMGAVGPDEGGGRSREVLAPPEPGTQATGE